MQSDTLASALTKLLSLAAAAALVVFGAATAAPPVQTVPQLDHQRYAGIWYELARLPNRLQARCVGDATATYRPAADGSLTLVRRCREVDDRWGVAVGRATVADSDTSGARLRVNYLPRWLQWWPSAYDDHWVVLLDDDYRYAVVSDPQRRTLWILSRTPTLDMDSFDNLMTRLRAQKYPVDRLVPTPQRAARGAPAFAAHPPLVV
ncbi:MAG TPA: lipocalin family protein [Albitalea sp.]|jgi:apolipoprotein D and lipocalin family protein|nr:lipocalin family protein [Albitalea sp.]